MPGAAPASNSRRKETGNLERTSSRDCEKYVLKIAASRMPAEPGSIQHAIVSALGLLHRIASRRLASVLGIGIAVVLIRLALLPLIPIPHPWMGDEFSYLLGADTFASGRLTNPTPHFWRSFEALHVIMQPTYMSKYPPGQAAFLALGQVFFGNPYWGVVLGMALFCAAVCWMLQIFVSPGWALIGGIFTFAVFGVNYYWMESYWGGGVAAFGGCLITGAAFRLLRKAPGERYIWPLCAGIALVFFTRPYEGSVFTAAVLVMLAAYLRRQEQRNLRRLLIALILSGVCVLGFQAFYDWRITGAPLVMPYLVHERAYTAVPTFWFQSLKTGIPRPSDPVLYGNHWYWEMTNYQGLHQMPLWRCFAAMIYREFGLLAILFGVLLNTLWLVPVFWSDFRVRFLAMIAAPVMLAASLAVYAHTHYIAPVLPAIIGLIFVVIQKLRSLRMLSGRRAGTLMSGVALLVVLGSAAMNMRLNRRLIGFGITPGGVAQAVPEEVARAAAERDALDAKLKHNGEKHLVIVHYTPNHEPAPDWVHNGANIDLQTVIWARDRGPSENGALISYYRGRKIWLLIADNRKYTFGPYDARLVSPDRVFGKK
jgi:hypothetical protein